MSRGSAIFALAVSVLAAPARAADEVPAAAADRAEGKEWAVRVDAAGGAAGAAAQLRLSSRAGYHVNLEYPIGFRPGPDSTITFREERVALTPAGRTACEGRPEETCAVVLALPGAVPEHGERRLAGTLAFSVCSPERCLIEKVPLRATLRR